MADDDRPAGIRRVSAVIGAGKAKLEAKVKAAAPQWPIPGMPLDGVKPGEWQEHGALDETLMLPDSCPVFALGYEGENFCFVDTAGQVFGTGDKAMGVERIQKLFAGAENWLCWAWPQFDKKGRVVGFNANHARRDLFAACRKRGPWNMTDKVRGRGAWLDGEGRLLIHCGEWLWHAGELREPGEIDGFFYPRRPAAVVPWQSPVVAADNPAREIFELLRTWNFSRGDIDRMILLGSIGVAMLAGALDWRPSIFITGDAGTGKSELTGKNGLLRAIHGRLMVSTTNATEAGLYQLVGHDSLPIAIDELEGDEAPDQTAKIIKMARDAASGSVRIRGGQDHKGVEFQAQSSFVFSGINPPPLPPASLTRLAILQLMPLKQISAKPPVLKSAETVGPRLLRHLADSWGKIGYQLDDYYAVLREAGYDARGQKTFGTFIALADVMLGDEALRALGLPCDERAEWGQMLAPELMPEIEGKKEGWRHCLDEIWAVVIDQHLNGKRSTIAQVLEEYKDNDLTFAEARSRLAQADIGLIGTRGSREDPLYLCIPHQSRILGRALVDTPYGHRGGAGNWRFALSRGPESVIKREVKSARGKMTNKVTVAGRQERCTFIDLNGFVRLLEQE